MAERGSAGRTWERRCPHFIPSPFPAFTDRTKFATVTGCSKFGRQSSMKTCSQRKGAGVERADTRFRCRTCCRTPPIVMKHDGWPSVHASSAAPIAQAPMTTSSAFHMSA
jgi:hypothetical protein